MNRLFLFLGLAFVLNVIFPMAAKSQQLGEMKVELVPEGEGVTFIVRNPEESILIVHSTIPELSFESNQGVIGVDNPDPGEYRLHLLPGTHIITFKAEGYLPLKERFHIPKKEYREVRVRSLGETDTVVGRGDVAIISNPTGAIVSFNGIILPDKTPVTLRDQPATQHSLRLYLEGNNDYLPTITDITVRADETNEFNFNLVRKTGTVTFNTGPDGASVYLDDELVGITPARLDSVPTGTYAVRIERDGFDTVLGMVTVAHREEADVSMVLSTSATRAWRARRRQSRLLALVLPGFGQLNSAQNRGLLYAGAFYGAAYWGYTHYENYQVNLETFHEEWDAYLAGKKSQAAMDEHYQSLTDARLAMQYSVEQINLSLSVIAGTYALQLFDALIFGGGRRPVTEVENVSLKYRLEPLLTSHDQGVKASLQIEF